MGNGRKRTGVALVIGGGISGLLAARVLVDHFQEVVVMERDYYPREPQSRAGVPQDRQLHLLLLKGQEVLRTLFPHLERHLEENGALQHDYGAQTFYYYRARCPVHQSLPGWLSSRVLLERQIREELTTSYPQMCFLEGCEVVGLVDAGSGAVGGVKFRKRDQPEHVQERTAKLVVDASGVSSRAPEWLKALGYEAPKETLIDVSLGYTTRYYRVPIGKESVWKLISIQGMGGRRSGTLMCIEGGRIAVVLAGVGGDFPDQTDDGYLAFAESLPDAALYTVMKELEPITKVYGYRRTANRFRHYERVSLPENFLVVGDAFCSFNPVYGQGMTVAALEALVLGKCLQGRSGRLSSRFHRRAAQVVRMPWFQATAVDKSLLEHTAVAGEVPHKQRSRSLPRRYLDRITMLISVDSYVALTFFKVMHMLQSPLAFLHPLVMFRVLFRRLPDR